MKEDSVGPGLRVGCQGREKGYKPTITRWACHRCLTGPVSGVGWVEKGEGVTDNYSVGLSQVSDWAYSWGGVGREGRRGNRQLLSGLVTRV